MKGRVISLAALFGCATAPAVVVTTDEISSISRKAAESSLRFDEDGFRVSDVAVREGVVVVELSAADQGEGWNHVESTSCRRPDDDSPWTCLPLEAQTKARIPGGPTVRVVGLEGAEAVRVLEFLKAEPPDALRPNAQVVCLVSGGNKRILAEYSGVIHHGGSSTATAVVVERAGSLVVESAHPTPSWFEAISFGLPECR